MAQVSHLVLPRGQGPNERVIWIGSRWKLSGQARQLGDLFGVPGAQIVPCHIDDIEKTLEMPIVPSFAMSMVMWFGADALDAARKLEECGFRGPYRAFSPNLPNPDLIETEVRRAAPTLDFGVITRVELQSRTNRRD